MITATISIRQGAPNLLEVYRDGVRFAKHHTGNDMREVDAFIKRLYGEGVKVDM